MLSCSGAFVATVGATTAPRLSCPPAGRPFSSVERPSKGSFPSKKLGNQMVSREVCHSLIIFSGTLRTFGRIEYEVSSPAPLRLILIEKFARPSSVQV